jgi:hypothetical protein
MSQDEMPEQPKTAQLPAADPVQVLLMQLRNQMTAGFNETRADLESVKNEGQRTNLRLTRLEMRQDDVETRLTRSSDGVRGLSQHDVEHDAQLAQEKAAREALATKVDDLSASQELQLAILGRLDKLAANPTVKVILFALGTIATGYLASKGLAK